MKRLYFTLLILPIYIYTFGQVSNYGIDDFISIREDFYENYSDTIQDTNYLKTIKQFKRWEQFWGPRMTKYNSFDSITHKRMAYYTNKQMSHTNEQRSNWKELGPNINGISGIGRIDAIEIDPLNSNVIYAGSPSGGLWKTIDGGANWLNISDNFFTSLGISSIAIEPTNSDIIYAATGDVDSETTYSHGIFRSNDGGNSWETINSGLIDAYTPHFTVGKMILHPNNNTVAYLATSLGIYKSSNRNDNTPQWTKVYPNSGNEYIRNIGFNPDNPNTLYAVGIDIVSSTDNGGTWTSIATASNGLDFSGTPWPNALNGLYMQMLNMAIDPNGKYIYVNGIVRDSPPPYSWNSYVDYKLWQYDIEYDIWTTKNAFYGTYSSQSILTVGRNEMVVSPIDSEHLYAGGVYRKQSYDGGVTWSNISAPGVYIHVDYHELVFDPNNNNILFVGTDGGVYRIDLEIPASSELNNGLGISTMYNMASSVIDEYQILAGMQDCGNNYFKNNNWTHEMSSDGFEAYFDEEDIDIMYATNYAGGNGSLWRSTNDANNPGGWTRINNQQESAWFGAALVAHPEETDELFQARKSIWKISNARTGSSTDWEKISDFDNKFPFMHSICYALEIAPSDGDVIYTSIVESSSWVINYNQVKLLKTSIGGGLGINHWVDITPDPYDNDYTYFISDIAVSSQNSSDVWVCYSGYIDGLKVRHFNGGSWNEYSEGLPNVPLNTIVYYEGSDDMLFVGTDIGVYYRDNSMSQWEPFSENLPSVIVNWLEINYTNHILRAGTYGRGLWETDLLCALPGEETSVNINTSWDTPMLVRNTVTVSSGAELTITSDVSFSPFAKIIVKPGGKLILDGATLTSSCDEPWQGIQVWGNKTKSQYSAPGHACEQGRLDLINGATIENAIIAVDLWNPDHWETTGGIVFADGAIFRNNAKSVHALHYRNFNPYYPEVEWDYMSNFKNCTFEITEAYPGKVTFYKHVDLAHVKGIDFQACDFSVGENITGVSTWNHAIAGYDAKFRVSAICSSGISPCPEQDYDKCTFTGFFSAINAVNDGEDLLSFSVNRAVFDDNSYGVKTRYMNNASVLFSDFSIGHLYECGAGIYADNVTGFAFEENNFSKYSGGPVSDYFGIIIYNSQAVNEVYNNNFTGLSYANFSDGQNWEGIYRFFGLAYYCNDNFNNYTDFYVDDFGPNKSSGIQTYQGNENYVAGNSFTQNGATWHFYNGGEHLVGYYFNKDNTSQIPILSKTENVAPYPRTVTEYCPSHYGGSSELKLALSTQQRIDAEQEYYYNYTDYLSVKVLYDSYIDGGDTEGEIIDIQTALPDEMWELRAQLLGDSPHLSLEVLIEAADKTDVFTESALFDILAANPDELKKDTLISYLENKEDPLPEYMIDILKQLAEGVTYKTILQQEMSSYKQNYVRAAFEIIRSNLNDTITNLSELRNWLDNVGGIASDRQIITTYISEDNFTNAFALANMLPGLYELKGNDSIEHIYYMDMLNLYNTLHQEGRNTFQLSQTEKEGVELIANTSKGVAGAQAKSIMEAVYLEEYTDCPNADGVAGYKHIGSINNSDFGKVYGLDITVKPNPAKDWAAYDYTLPAGKLTATITISTVTGRVVEILELSGQQGQKLWDTRNIKPGVYVYTLQCDGMRKSGKIVISK